MLKAIHVMEDNLATPLSVSELAVQAGVSQRQLERQFRATFNATPLQFFLRLRLERARDLIAHTDRQIDDIADLTGFSSVPILSRKYRKAFGTSPFGKSATTGPQRKFVRRSEKAVFSSQTKVGTAIDPSP